MEFIKQDLIDAVLLQRKDPIQFELLCAWERAYQEFNPDYPDLFDSEATTGQ